VGIVTMLGARVPAGARVMLLALAVIDDLGAIAVIALFYSSGVALSGLLTAALGLIGILVLQRLGVRLKAVYVVPGLVIWAGVLAAGIHPTIAGVIIGLLTPVRAWLGPRGFRSEVDVQLAVLDAGPTQVAEAELRSALHQIGVARREARSPAESLIHSLHPWVAFGIMPLFALANAGVQIGDDAWELLSSETFWAVLVGLVVGKPVGVWLACAIAIKTKIGALPASVSVRHVVLLGLVASVGFTMALFIAQLAFPGDGPASSYLGAAKLGVLIASATASLISFVFGRAALAMPGHAVPPASADQAEQGEG
jgi:NhaA family Na+:H+ antiporter